MGKLIGLYLIVTGIVALVAVMMPGLVIIGLYMLVLPGLILSLAPTAFLWGLIFASFWIVARWLMLSELAASAIALGATAAVLATATLPARKAAEAQFHASIRPDIDPPARIAMRGDIRIDRRNPNWDNQNSAGQRGLRGFSCDNLCLAMLFTPGVRSVTVNAASAGSAIAPFDREARTYRLVPKAQCEGEGLKPDLSGRDGVFPGDERAGQALEGEWYMQLANEVCLERAPQLLERHDMLIAQMWTRVPNEQGRWRFSSTPFTSEALEIRGKDGTVLLRRFKGTAQVIARPLWINWTGGSNMARFGWAREALSNNPRYDAVDLLNELAAHTNIVGKADPVKLLPGLRQTLQSALDDAAALESGPSFALLPSYFDAVPMPLAAEDLRLLVRLVGDARIRKYGDIHRLRALPAEQLQPLREAAVRRALASNDPVALAGSGLDIVLQLLPKSSFAVLTRDEIDLLADTRRRLALPTLIKQLAEPGPKYLDLLVEMVATHDAAWRAGRGQSTYYDESRAHGEVVGAARVALCRLGPAAHRALPALDAQVAKMVRSGGFDARDWDLALARMGKPVETFRKPDAMSGDDERYRRNLALRLARFNADQDC